MITIVREEGANVLHSSDPSEIPALLASKDQVFWLDMEAPTQEEFDLLSRVFHFHPLAIEDAAHPRQRPKLDEYEGYFFLTADEVTLNLDARAGANAVKEADVEAVNRRQVAMFLGPNYLVTVHYEPLNAMQALRGRCDQNHRLLDKGADYLLYALLDVLVDAYFPMLDALDDQLDDLEDRIVANPTSDILETIFTLKRELARFRKYVGPLREVLQALTTRDLPGVQERTLPYYRDVADHLFRIYETLDSYRDLMSNMLDAYLSQVSNEMNRVMQKLSVVATVFLPITFITGVFGMNFERQPWIKTDFWFWMFCMGAVAAFTYWWFHRRHWV